MAEFNGTQGGRSIRSSMSADNQELAIFTWKVPSSRVVELPEAIAASLGWLVEVTILDTVSLPVLLQDNSTLSDQ